MKTSVREVENEDSGMSRLISRSEEVRMEHKKCDFKNEKERARGIMEALKGMNKKDISELK